MQTMALYRKLSRMPGGKRVFSFAFSQFAPYFWTVRPQVRQVRKHHAELLISKRRAVQNHIGTVHAIAVCNGLEAAMGLLAEATTPPTKRWIPKGMQVNYVAKSTTDLLCTADTDPRDWDSAGDVPVRVRAIRTDGVVVVEGTITIYVSGKR